MSSSLQLWDEGLVWLIGVLVCLLAAAVGPILRRLGQWMPAECAAVSFVGV